MTPEEYEKTVKRTEEFRRLKSELEQIDDAINSVLERLDVSVDMIVDDLVVTMRKPGAAFEEVTAPCVSLPARELRAFLLDQMQKRRADVQGRMEQI